MIGVIAVISCFFLRCHLFIGMKDIRNEGELLCVDIPPVFLGDKDYSSN